MKEAVFSMWCVPRGYREYGNANSLQLSVGDSHGEFLVEEELEVEDSKCDLKALYVL
jgi:hypothetical protein